MGTPHIVGDRVLVQTTTTGTGTYSLGAALDGFLSPAQAGIATGSRVCATVVDSLTAPTQFEVVEGIYTSGSPATLTRARVVRNSAGTTAAINWGSGTRYLFLTPNATRLVLLDTDGMLPSAVMPQALMSQVFSGALQSIPNNTSTNMGWNQMGVNTLGAQPGANPAFALVPPVDGLYRATLCVSFASNTVGQRLAEIIIGGTTRTRVRASAATGDVDLNAVWEGPMTGGQNVQAFVYQNSGGALGAGGTPQSSFTLTKL